ncbi:hypothetical protein Tco_1193120 [Tanacetum coccineum]
MIKRVYCVKGLNYNYFSVGQFCDADLEVAFRKSTCFVRDPQGNDLLTGTRGSDLYIIPLQDLSSSTPICLLEKASPTQAWLKALMDEKPELLKEFLKMIQRNLQAQNSVVKRWNRTLVEVARTMLSGLTPQQQMMSDYDDSGPAPQPQKTFVHNNTELRTHDHGNEPSSSKLDPNVSPLADTYALSLKELDFLFNTQSTANIQPTTEPITLPTNVNAEENNTYQVVDARFKPYEFINPFCTLVQEVAESSSHNVDTSNMHTFDQRHQADYRWTKKHPLEQVRGNPSKPVQTR